MPPLSYRTIAIREKTKTRFDAHKKYPRETADETLNRILDENNEMWHRLHSTSEEDIKPGGSSSTHAQGDKKGSGTNHAI